MTAPHAPAAAAGTWAFWWHDEAAGGQRKTSPHAGSSWQVIGGRNIQEGTQRDPDRHTVNDPPAWAEDLYRVARAVFLADKHAPRSRADDGWTRSLHVSVPVQARERWTDGTHRRLTSLLESMTGDTWEIAFRPDGSSAAVAERLTFPTNTEVTLFSGGLDSLSWAAKLAADSPGSPLLLVQFAEQNLERVQENVYKALPTGFRELRFIRHSQTIQRHPRSKDPERSSRTRGFLYAAAAVRIAAAEGSSTVHIPENGQVALNPPLNASRSAACSTRSVHPWTLRLLNELIAGIVAEDEGAVEVVNPLADLTKGEVCQLGRERLDATVLHATLSCGHPPPRWAGTEQKVNCGSCYPCLIRRSGLHTIGEDKSGYVRAPWDRETKPEHSVDWRALLRWTRRPPYTVRDLIADTPLPDDADPEDLVAVINRGRDELRSWVAAVTEQRKGSGE